MLTPQYSERIGAPRLRWTVVVPAALFLVAILTGVRNVLGAEDAKAMFQDTCSRCHGPDGFGDGPDGQTLSTRPRNFHDCAIMARDSDDKVFDEIKGGSASIGRSNDMPSWGEALSDDEIRGLIAYVRHFCPQK